MYTDMKADISKIAAALAASLIAADGVIEEEEKRVAVHVGQSLFPGFSTLCFETLLDGLDELPSAYEIATTLRELLNDEDKELIVNYLVAIAAADNEIVEVERKELETVAEALGVELPPLVSNVST